MRQATYEIRLRGALPPELLTRLPGATSTQGGGGETLLLTPDLDQASLHQLVARLRDLGIELLELRKATTPRRPGRERDKP
jgi:hypothetical protein